MTVTARPLPVPSADIATSAHSFDEYRHALGLTGADMRGRVLDCPGGASDLTAGIVAAGGDAVAVDPLYGLDPGDLRRRVLADVEAAGREHDSRPDDFDDEVLGGPEERRALRMRTVDTFLDHIAASPDRYHAAALPDLPFADGTFDLALTSHLLFAYPDALTVEDHVAALVELGRVAHEVRAYPLVDVDGMPRPELVRSVISRLKKARLACRIEPVTRPFQRAATTRLVVEHVRRPDRH